MFLIPAEAVDLPPPEPAAGRAPRWVGGAWRLETPPVMPVPEEVPTPAPRRVVTALAFLERLTAEERIAIRRAARVDEGLEDWLDMLRSALEVDLDDPRTIAGMNAMVGAGLLSAERVEAVLASLAPREVRGVPHRVATPGTLTSLSQPHGGRLIGHQRVCRHHLHRHRSAPPCGVSGATRAFEALHSPAPRSRPPTHQSRCLPEPSFVVPRRHRFSYCLEVLSSSKPSRCRHRRSPGRRRTRQARNPVSLEQLVLATTDDLRRIKKKEPPLGETVMRFAECEIELAVKTTVAANGKLKFWIVEIGGSAGQEATSRIKLKFTPLSAISRGPEPGSWPAGRATFSGTLTEEEGHHEADAVFGGAGRVCAAAGGGWDKRSF